MRLPRWVERIIKQTLSSVTDARGWFPLVRDHYPGAWQRNDEWSPETVLAHSAVYACITLIASDIAKLRIKLVEQDADGIWSETRSAAFSPVLRKPNRYQTRIQFVESWITSKLMRGNTYVLKEYDGRGSVVRMYVLDPNRVRPLVAPDGSVFYDLQADNVSGIAEQIVPARMIIHDRINCLFHPLVGTSPIFACGSAANVGLRIQSNSASLFANDNTPPGLLTAPGTITQADAEQLAARWQARKRGQVAVMGNGLTFEKLTMSAEDSQLIEQLKWTDETVCRAFHVPPFKIGAGTMPTYSNGEILDARYYSDCLQSHIEHLELCLDEGLGLSEPKEGKQLGTELDLDGLLRMDTKTQMDTLAVAVGSAIYSPDEARQKVDKKPVKGGASPYLQQQNFSLAALAERDADKPFAKPAEPSSAPPVPKPDDEEKRQGSIARRTLLFRDTLNKRVPAWTMN